MGILSNTGSPGLIPGNLPLQGETHEFEKPNRRGFLKDTAALAGLAAGGARLGKGQTPGTPPKKIDELIAYGERSRFMSFSKREIHLELRCRWRRLLLPVPVPGTPELLQALRQKIERRSHKTVVGI